MMLKQLMPEAFCLSCQGCCRFLKKESEWSVVVFDQEQGLIPCNNNKIDLKFDSQENKYFCVFFNRKQNACDIYEKRPFDCQLYPFLLNFQEEELFLAVDLNCPFIEKNFESQLFQDYVEYLKDLFISSSVKEMITKNKNLLQCYAGVKNICKLDY